MGRLARLTDFAIAALMLAGGSGPARAADPPAVTTAYDVDYASSGDATFEFFDRQLKPKAAAKP
jgi:hypothetical protein